METITNFKKSLRNHEFTWRYLYNFGPSLSYLFSPRPRLTGEAGRVLEEFNRNGVAVTTAEKLLGAASAFDELAAAVDAAENENRHYIEAARAHANDANAIGKKTFLYHLLGDKPLLDPDSIYTRFALQKEILQIANAYLGLFTQLRYHDVWHTIATTAPARESQLWHRDREDYFICKVFVYLNDVDDGAGPFTYATGTHFKGPLRAEPPFSLEGHVQRSDDSQMAVVAPKDKWITGTGRRGTIIFADTRGYHKGGLARTSDRIMYNCMFTSPASQVREMMRRPEKIALPSVPEQAFALMTPRRKSAPASAGM
jgi:hypothetical protein